MGGDHDGSDAATELSRAPRDTIVGWACLSDCDPVLRDRCELERERASMARR